MWILRRPTQRPTPFEYGVIAIVLAGLLTIFGVVALGAAALAPPEKAEIAAQLFTYGGWSLGLGVVIAAGYWLVWRFMS